MEATKFLRKSILKNKILIIAIIVLMSSVIFLFNYLYLGVLDVHNNYQNMVEKSELSDCQYIPKLELSDDEMMEIIKEYNIPLEEIEDDDLIDKYNVNLNSYYEKRLKKIRDKYDVDYEAFKYKVINYDGKTYFITKHNSKINPPLFSVDKKLKNGEVFITNKSSDSLLEYKNKGYYIVGEFSSIDFIQLYDLKKSQSNLALDNVGVFMSSKDYNDVNAKEQLYYNLKFKSKKEYKKFLNEYEDESILCNDTDEYLANFEDVISMNFRLAYIAIIAYFFVSIVIFYITYKNFLDSLDKDFGLLKIIGVKTRTIVLAVVGIYLCILLVSDFLGNMLGVLTQNAIRQQFRPLYNFIYLNNYYFGSERIAFTLIINISILVIVVLLLCIKLSSRILVLLKSESLSANSILLRKTKWIMSKFPLRNQVKTSFALKKISRILIIFMGTFLCTNFLAIGVGLYYKQLTQVNELNESTDFDKAYYFDEIGYGVNMNAAYIEETDLLFDGKKQKIQVVGINKKGNVFSDEIYEGLESEEMILSKNIAKKNNLKVGDKVTININDEDIEYTVGKVLDSNYEYRCYVELQSLYKKNLDNNAYNVLYEKKGEDGLKNQILDKAVRIEKIDDYKSNNINSFSQILMIVGVLMIFSILAVIIVFSLISSLNIHDSIADIKIMRFLGYSKGRIRSLTITTYFCMIILTMFGGYFVFPSLCNKFEELINVSNWDFYLGVDGSLKIYLLSCFVVILNYYFWMLMVYHAKVKELK